MDENPPSSMLRAPGRASRRPLRPRHRGRYAFTLIELISVLVIISLLASISIPKFQELVDRSRATRAIGDLRTVTQDLLVRDSLPGTLAEIGRGGMLDPWGRLYVYVKLPAPVGMSPPAGSRLDRFGVNINTRFDLYSMGPDGGTALSLTASNSQDDVVSANDGGYYGLGSKY